MNDVRSMVMETVDAALEKLAAEFDRCRPWIGDALRYSGGSHTIEDVRKSVMTGELILWPAANAFMIAEVEQYPRRRNYHIFLAGGSMEGLKALRPLMEEGARRAQCGAVTLTGRKGWARSFLKDCGYEMKWVLMAKELKNGEG